MCGICGIYSSSPRTDLLGLIKPMNALLHHRGPDEEGYFSDSHVALGHKRLSIIDLSSGQQPIFNEDETSLIVYNGELYNYKELRIDLERRGHRFKTNSDTEVILHSFEEYGADCARQFNGMFAFAIWDSHRQRLFLARDRLGIKPLYYHFDPSAQLFLFASEIKALLAYSAALRQPEYSALADYLVYQNLIGEKTFFQNIHILPPAHRILWENGRMEKDCYWAPNFAKQKLASRADYLAAFETVLARSVRRQLMSDVPLGAYLSGGFDSSSVAYFAAHALPQPLTTFTGYFEEGPAFDERDAAAAVARAIGANQQQTAISPGDFRANFARIVYHMDEPRVGPGVVPQYQVSQLVSRHVKVVLTGHGGDELFCGYPLYKMHYLRQLIGHNPLHILSLLRSLRGNEWKAAIVNILLPLFRPEMGWGLNLSLNHRAWRRILHPRLLKQLQGYNPLTPLRRLLDSAPADPLDRVQFLYLKAYLPSLFIVEDKVGMAHSIEARLPLCDNEMVDLALSIPVEEKLKNFRLKSIIKDAMRAKLPAELYRQPKMGFPTPLDKWFRHDLRGLVTDTLLHDRCLSRGIFQPDYVKMVTEEHLRGKTNRQHQLWQLLNIEMWHRVFIDHDDATLTTDKDDGTG